MGEGRRGRVRGWRVRVFLAMALGALAARCSALTTFDGFASGNGTDAGSDGPITADGSSDGGTTTDGSAASDGAPSDAGAGDARPGDGGDAAASDAGFCASLSPAPMFCDDFDTPDAGFTKWTLDYEFGGGTIAIDSAESHSPPSSLLVSTPSSANPAGGRLTFSPPGTAKHVHFGFDLKIDMSDPQSGYAEVGYVVFTGAFKDDFYLDLHTDPTNNGFTTEAYPDGSPVTHELILPNSTTLAGWKRVVIDVDLATAHSVTMTVDGVMVVQQALEPELYLPGTLEVRPGIGYTGAPSNGWALRFDNVTIDWD
jgi:hypothetical protein